MKTKKNTSTNKDARQKALYRKRQIQWDTLLMITNRTFDVAIMFFSVFAFIYVCNGQYMIALIYAIVDAIVIPINNGPQAFRWFHQEVSKFRAQSRSNH